MAQGTDVAVWASQERKTSWHLVTPIIPKMLKMRGQDNDIDLRPYSKEFGSLPFDLLRDASNQVRSLLELEHSMYQQVP